MTTVELIKALEASVKSSVQQLDATINEWREADTTERSAIETRMKGLEDTIATLKTDIAEKQRLTLPGSEPSTRQNGERFSLARCAQAMSLRSWEGAGYEKSVIDEMKLRAMSAGTDSAGGFIVPDQAIPQLIEKLKAQAIALALGARELNATGSPIIIPRVKTSVTAGWMTGENTTINASDMVLGQMSLSPKTLASRVILSNQLLELSLPAADALIEDDMASQLGLGLDFGALMGTGFGGSPLGIINDPDVLTESITSAQIKYAELVGFQDALDTENALRGKLGFALHPAMFTQAMKIETITGAGGGTIEVVRKAIDSGGPQTLLGYPFKTTTAFTASTGAGSMVFGNWDDMIIALWGGLRLRSSDVSDDAFSKDQTHIRGIMRADIGRRHAESFCKAA